MAEKQEETQVRHNVFVYGTLQEPTILQTLIHRQPEQHIAYLENYALAKFKNSTILYAFTLEGTAINGRIINVSDRELQIIDNYEGSAYTRTHVETSWGYAYIYEISETFRFN